MLFEKASLKIILPFVSHVILITIIVVATRQHELTLIQLETVTRAFVKERPDNNAIMPSDD